MTIKLVAYLGFTGYPFRFPCWGGVVNIEGLCTSTVKPCEPA